MTVASLPNYTSGTPSIVSQRGKGTSNLTVSVVRARCSCQISTARGRSNWPNRKVVHRWRPGNTRFLLFRLRKKADSRSPDPASRDFSVFESESTSNLADIGVLRKKQKEEL